MGSIFIGGEGLELNLNNTVQIIAIIAFAAGVVKYMVVIPLQGAIITLERAVEELKTVLCRMDQDQKGIDKRLVAVEESAKSAHKRLDGLEVHS